MKTKRIYTVEIKEIKKHRVSVASTSKSKALDSAKQMFLDGGEWKYFFDYGRTIEVIKTGDQIS